MLVYLISGAGIFATCSVGVEIVLFCSSIYPAENIRLFSDSDVGKYASIISSSNGLVTNRSIDLSSVKKIFFAIPHCSSFTTNEILSPLFFLVGLNHGFSVHVFS